MTVKRLKLSSLPGGGGADRFDGEEHGAGVSFFVVHSKHGAVRLCDSER
jgi:hypothetical protein